MQSPSLLGAMSAVPRNHGMNEAAPEALVALAEEFASAGAPLQAIKCLETVAQLRTSVLPLTEVHARLRLALLLMQWADNVQAAKAHLERAVRAVRARREGTCC